MQANGVLFIMLNTILLIMNTSLLLLLASMFQVHRHYNKPLTHYIVLQYYFHS